MNEPQIDDVESFRRESKADARHHGKGLSVTRALRRAGLVKFFVSPARLAVLAEEGTQVHMVCGDIANGDDTDYWREIPWLIPYATAYQQFQRDFEFRAELIEERVEHPAGYFGFLDMAGTIFADSKKHARKAVVEIKRAVPAKPYALQVAAYQQALAAKYPAFKIAVRTCVYLKADGSYKAEEHGSPFDWVNFQHALGTARLREQWGLVDARDEARFDDIIHGGRSEDFEEIRL